MVHHKSNTPCIELIESKTKGTLPSTSFSSEFLAVHFRQRVCSSCRSHGRVIYLALLEILYSSARFCRRCDQIGTSGLFSLLDDECKMGNRGSDKNWAHRIHEKFGTNPHFAKPSAKMGGDEAFIVKHCKDLGTMCPVHPEPATPSRRRWHRWLLLQPCSTHPQPVHPGAPSGSLADPCFPAIVPAPLQTPMTCAMTCSTS